MSTSHAFKPSERGLIVTDDAEVRAYLNGSKTAVLAPVIAANSYVDGFVAPKLFASLVFDGRVYADPGPSPAGNAGPYLHVPHRNGDTVHRVYPRMQVGERLWVKEAFAVITGNGIRIVYRADDRTRKLRGHGREPDLPIRWHHASRMHRGGGAMPRLPRITLEVRDVAAKRLHDITDRAAIAHGCGLARIQSARTPTLGPILDALANAWDRQHGKTPGLAWKDNPWTFALTLRRLL